jgi:hypothetical protein
VLQWLGAGGVVRVLDGGGREVAHRWLEARRQRSGGAASAWGGEAPMAFGLGGTHSTQLKAMMEEGA